MRRARQGLLHLALLTTLGLSTSPAARNEASPDRSLQPPAAGPKPGSSVQSKKKRVPMSLSKGAAVPLLAEMVHIYPLPLQADEFARLAFEQQNLDVAVEIYDAERRRLLKVDSLTAGRERPELVPFVAPASGAYTVEVPGCATCGEGTYRIRLEARRPATPTDREWAAAAVTYYEGRELERKDAKSKNAEAKYQSAFDRWEKLGYTQGKADALVRMGTIAYARYDWPRGLKLFQSVLPIYEKSGNRRQEAAVLYQVGLGYQQTEQAERAVASYEKALRVSRETQRPDVTADALIGLGLIDLNNGEYGRALANLLEAETVARKNGNRVSLTAALNGLGRLCSLMGEIQRALRYHQEALELARSGGKENGIALSYQHFGDAFRVAEKHEQSVSHYLDAIGRFRRLGDLGNLGITLNNLGLTYYRMKRYEDALESYSGALKIFRELGNRAEEAAALANIGWVSVSLDRPDEAVPSFEASLSLARKLKRPATSAATFFGLAWTERLRRNPILARGHAERSLELIETLRTKTDRRNLRQSFLARSWDVYGFLVDLLMEQQRLGRGGDYDIKALEINERGRARSLLDSIEAGSIPPLALEEIRRKVLDRDTILLSYSLGEDRSYLWVVTPTSLTSHELAPRERIESLASETRDLLWLSHRKENQEEALKKAGELSRLLLGPVANRLGHKRLLLVLPPSLQAVPFSALPDLSVSQSRDPKRFWPTPLLYNHEIVAAPSASVVAALRKRQSGRQPAPRLLALLGDPVSSASDDRLQALRPRTKGEPPAGRFPRLRFSGDEADMVEAAAGKGDSLVRTGFEANRDFVRQGGLAPFRILHFTTHGLLSTEDPERSALVLSQFDSQGRTIDGLLRARDVASLKLQADLAVLSACQTGLGKEIEGEGLVGLTQAFFAAGVPRVVVTLWRIDDWASSELMRRFYHHLLVEKLPAAAALRRAQISMWQEEKYNFPSDWAGFVLQGEWQ